MSKFRRELRRILRPAKTGCDYRADVSIEAPLLLISQMSRSGGTLLSQLFDHHPQCFAHPGELHIGKPRKWNWPDFDPSDRPIRLWKALYEKRTEAFVKRGYEKFGKGRQERFPFVFDVATQRRTFLKMLRPISVPTERDVLNAYWSSYFVAWHDYQNMYGGDKKYVTGFVCKLSMYRENIERFFRCYPDGYLLSVVRDPWSWLSSAIRHTSDPEFSDPNRAIELWADSVSATLENATTHGDRVVAIDFHDLVRNTESTMQSVALTVGIDWSDSLIKPTFNGMPIQANSSFSDNMNNGIIDSVRDRSDAERLRIVSPEHIELYESTRSLTQWRLAKSA